jgi:demethoxyubiquinone hydroxylase (CLK1/Coq7/Cat5 family)
MDISERELRLLNFYRASELHGGLLLGQMARRARDPRVLLDLTNHSADEIGHAKLWTECILAVGGTPGPVRDTYQSRYAELVGMPVTLLQVLALTQVFERRVYRHFMKHLRLPGTHPIVATTLKRMIEEEKDHLSWVKAWLEDQAGRRPAEVRALMKEYTRADAIVYETLVREIGWREAA